MSRLRIRIDDPKPSLMIASEFGEAGVTGITSGRPIYIGSTLDVRGATFAPLQPQDQAFGQALGPGRGWVGRSTSRSGGRAEFGVLALVPALLLSGGRRSPA